MADFKTRTKVFIIFRNLIIQLRNSINNFTNDFLINTEVIDMIDEFCTKFRFKAKEKKAST